MTALDILHSVNFNWTRQLRSIWETPHYHVPTLHASIINRIIDDLSEKTATDDDCLGQVIVAPAGYGKTHLMGELRRRTWEIGGWFILLDLIGVRDFWSTVALGFLSSLQVRMQGSETQYGRLILKIAHKLGCLPKLDDLVNRFGANPRQLIMEIVHLFIESLALEHPAEVLAHRDVITALILLGSEEFDCKSIAHGWLQGMTLEAVDVRPLGILSPRCEPVDVVRGLSWLMGVAGPTLIGVDQIDAIVTESNVRSKMDVEEDSSRIEAQSIVTSLAQGLMDLHEVKRKAMTVVACTEATWQILHHKSQVPVEARYNAPVILPSLLSAQVGERIVAARLKDAYSKRNFIPPYPTWPFAPQAFDSIVGLSPRELLRACDEHLRRCLATGVVTECTSFSGQPAPPRPPQPTESEHVFIAEQISANVDGLLEEAGEDRLRGVLLAALMLLKDHFELPGHIDAGVQSEPSQRIPALHGRLFFTFHAEGDREQHYCFRALPQTNAKAFQTRLKAAMTASGVDRALKFRHLFVLRRGDPPGGRMTADLVAQFFRAGGKFLAPTEADLRIFVALEAMSRREIAGFGDWLRVRKPLFETSFFRAVGLSPPPFLVPVSTTKAGQGPVWGTGPGGDADANRPPGGAAAAASRVGAAGVPPDRLQPGAPASLACSATVRRIPIGQAYVRGVPGELVALDAELLPRHIAVLAGAGSGKTVLIRRIIEEAALLNIPAVVLDSNNDLARLGEPWPSRPPGWTDAEAEKAAAYQDRVDVVIWTPGSPNGNPLSLGLLPDFAALRGDPDERRQAVAMALATLDPHIGASGRNAILVRGVFADALRSFAGDGDGNLARLIAFLSDLPEGASSINDAEKLAAKIADQLRAAVATNPLLCDQDGRLDCRNLFHSPAAGRTRVSVINFCGLTSDRTRDAFVNQLNMALFSWIKRNPSKSGMLYVIDEAQNFAPSQQATACKQSLVSLVSQARKYGLGMIFATQTPKAVDNRVVSNCTTHFYGKMNSPATIDAAQELMAAKGGGGDDVARLSTGEFYYATEGMSRPLKLRTPLCLSHHPKNPLTCEEVIERSRRRQPAHA